MPGAWSQILVIGHWPRPNLLEAARLALRARGFADSLTHPVVSGTGIKASKKLCERAIPAGFCVISRRCRDHLPRLLVLRPNQHHCRMRASIGEDLMGPVLLRPDVPFVLPGFAHSAPGALEHREQAQETDHPRQREVHQRGRKITGLQHPGPSHLQRPVSVAPDHSNTSAALASLPAKLPTRRRHHVLGVAVALKAGENYRILPRNRGRAWLGRHAGNPPPWIAEIKAGGPLPACATRRCTSAATQCC